MSSLTEVLEDMEFDKNTSAIIKALHQILSGVIKDNDFKPFVEKHDLKFVIKVLLTAKHDSLANQILLQDMTSNVSQDKAIFYAFVFTAHELFTKEQLQTGLKNSIEKLRSTSP